MREWDPLLAADAGGDLVRIMNETPDGISRPTKASPAATSARIFRQDRCYQTPCRGLSDAQIWGLKRGGHDYRKVYAATMPPAWQRQADGYFGQNGEGLRFGRKFEARNATHQMKKLTQSRSETFRDLLQIPVTDAQIDADSYQVPYTSPAQNSAEIRYLLERRRELGVIFRSAQPAPAAPAAEAKVFEAPAKAPANSSRRPPWRCAACCGT